MNRPMRLEDMLAFCMTELGHGSNVSAIETEAVYDHENRQFVINSPTPTSIKFWPGSLAKTGNIGIFYARLFVKE